MNLDILRKLRQSEATRNFSFPHELIDDPSLNMSQKREILAEWASDACAIESFPTLRLLPGTTFPVTLSAIMDALARLDGEHVPENIERQRAPKKAAVGRRSVHVPDSIGRGYRSDCTTGLHATC